ncbi:hypothetical protein MUK42_09899 [Musa troglodytarum]|uniref:Uncharacterized protein n=1 Tax=Musa troglodytarum TaxID=320322 RepID=A0A9E7EV77_9LILI|nr:hypothetical protein MUK42_09899 [Musa troglodytarum]
MVFRALLSHHASRQFLAFSSSHPTSIRTPGNEGGDGGWTDVIFPVKSEDKGGVVFPRSRWRQPKLKPPSVVGIRSFVFSLLAYPLACLLQLLPLDFHEHFSLTSISRSDAMRDGFTPTQKKKCVFLYRISDE